MNKTKKLTFSGLFLALTLLLPFLTGQIPQIGSALSPMHIPVLLCGFVCGGPFALIVGLLAPTLRFLLFGMPPLFPVGIAMTFELGAYGLISGIMYSKLPKKKISIYISLITAMLAGRVVWGAAMYFISLLTTVKFNISIFMAGAFIKAVPGIIVHIILIPVIVMALEKIKGTDKACQTV